MVTNNLRTPILIAIAAAVVAASSSGANGRKFYPDDPLPRVVDSQDASRMEEREIDLVYDTLENSVSWPGDRTPNVRAQNVNTIDEVPDSAWFTNRLGTRPVTVKELLQGPDTTTGPAPTRSAWPSSAAASRFCATGTRRSPSTARSSRSWGSTTPTRATRDATRP